MNVEVTNHAIQRFQERVGKRINDRPATIIEIKEFLKEKVANTKYRYSRPRKKQGIYRWNYYVEMPVNGKRFYISIKTDDNDDTKTVVLSVITEKQFRSLKGRI